MKNILKSVSVLAALTSLAFAGDEPKDLKKVIEDQGIYVETAKPGIVLSGYVDAGYTYGFNGEANTGGAVGARTVADSQRGSNFSLNAFKLALEKPLSTKNEWSAGFRADLIYGDDATSALGAGAGATAGSSDSVLLEQAFVQLLAPVGNGISFKVGKFVTPLGYEVIERPANQNITYGNLFNTMIPLYHTGILASYKVNDIVDVKAGIVNGANSDHQTNYANANTDNGAGLLGTVNITAPGGNANIQNGVFIALDPNTVSNGGLYAAPTSNALWVYDVWGQWKPKFTGDKLTLGFNGDLGEGSTSVADSGLVTSTTWGGAAVYAKYQFTKLFSLATRTDWVHENNSSKFATNGSAGGNDVYSFTATASFDVWENTLLRAEYRADYASEGLTTGGFGSPSSFAGTTSATTSKGIAHLIDLQVVYSF